MLCDRLLSLFLSFALPLSLFVSFSVYVLHRNTAVRDEYTSVDRFLAASGAKRMPVEIQRLRSRYMESLEALLGL